MKAEIVKKTKDFILIEWSKKGVGFGQLEMKWNKDKGSFDLDSEYMGIDHVVEVFKAITLN
tara:strand:+ start:335 stop:517 length:183 start_codon:yes stop_codon:yes gene_type:complete